MKETRPVRGMPITLGVIDHTVMVRDLENVEAQFVGVNEVLRLNSGERGERFEREVLRA